MLREVYSTATRTGELTQSNWLQVASIGHVVRTQINGDRDRLAGAVVELEQLVVKRDLKHRSKALTGNVAAVRDAHAALTESTRTWAQYSALRLWHLTVSGDPTTEAYRQELQTFIQSAHKQVRPLRIRAVRALRQIPEYRWKDRVLHPRITRRLPAESDKMLTMLAEINWRPLELKQPSKDSTS